MIYQLFRDFYEATIGEKLQRKKQSERKRIAEEIKREMNLTTLTEYINYIKAVEKKLKITEVSTAPPSRYYCIQSPQEFERRRKKTLKRFLELKPIPTN